MAAQNIDPQVILKTLGVTTTVTKRGPIPPGETRGLPLEGQDAAPGQGTPAPTASPSQGAGVGGEGEGGERDKNPGSATSLTTYVQTFLFFLQD